MMLHTQSCLAALPLSDEALRMVHVWHAVESLQADGHKFR